LVHTKNNPTFAVSVKYLKPFFISEKQGLCKKLHNSPAILLKNFIGINTLTKNHQQCRVKYITQEPEEHHQLL